MTLQSNVKTSVRAERQEEWDALPDSEQWEIFDRFQMDCIDGGKEPSEYWYPVLMPMLTK